MFSDWVSAGPVCCSWSMAGSRLATIVSMSSLLALSTLLTVSDSVDIAPSVSVKFLR